MFESVVRALSRRSGRGDAVLLLATLLCSLLGAQTLETTLYLPDTLVGATNASCVAWDSIDNTLYVCGYYGARAVAFNAADGAKLAAIPVGNGTRALCWNRTNNRAYAANTSDSTVTVIDCASNTVLQTILCGDVPRSCAGTRPATRYMSATATPTTSRSSTVRPTRSSRPWRFRGTQ
jgi:YVTN family beta-propeller protein